MKRLVSLLMGLSLVSCDSGTKHTEGTSSETQSSLQALADSLAEIDYAAAFEAAPALASRTSSEAILNPAKPPSWRIWYGWDLETGARISRLQSTHFYLAGVDSELIMDTIRFVDSTKNVRIAIKRLWTSFLDGQHWERMLESTTEGWTRAGFHYRSVRLSVEDRSRLSLDARLYPTDNWEAWDNAVLFSLGSEWELVATPLLRTDSLPLFRNGALTGWAVKLPGLFPSWPVFDFDGYRVWDLQGGLVNPRTLEPRSGWLGDSLGIFWGDMSLDSTGSDLLVPFRWRFLPGTIAGVQGDGTKGIQVWDPSDTLWPEATFHPEEDTGSGRLRFPGVASNGVLAGRHLMAAGWKSSFDSKLRPHSLHVPSFPR